MYFNLCSYDLTMSVLLQNLVVVAGSHNFPLLAMIPLVSRHGLLLAALILLVALIFFWCHDFLLEAMIFLQVTTAKRKDPVLHLLITCISSSAKPNIGEISYGLPY